MGTKNALGSEKQTLDRVAASPTNSHWFQRFTGARTVAGVYRHPVCPQATCPGTRLLWLTPHPRATSNVRPHGDRNIAEFRKKL